MFLINLLMWVFLIVSLSYSYPCKFSLPDGTIYDLSPFIRDMPDYEADAMDYVYRLNICADTLKLCNGDSGVATQWNYNGGCVAVLARQDPSPPVLTKTIDGVKLTYTNGNYCAKGPRKVSYSFHCSKGETRIGLAAEPEICMYEFDVYSKDACFTNKKKSKTYGWLLYGGLMLVVGYFIAGFAYKKYQDKELGFIEAIPHSEAFIECISAGMNKIRKPLS